MKKRVIVLDTNVLLHDPESPLHFANDNVVIPIQVVEEVDRFKRDPSEKGRNARRVSRLLDQSNQFSIPMRYGFNREKSFINF